MKLEPRKTYVNGWGHDVHIMGPTRTFEPRFWSVEGNHYTESGRMIQGSTLEHLCPTNAENEERLVCYNDLKGVAPDQSWWEGM